MVLPLPTHLKMGIETLRLMTQFSVVMTNTCHQRIWTSAESRDQFGNALTCCICDDIVRCTCAKVIIL
jgi:hypothetical protein